MSYEKLAFVSSRSENALAACAEFSMGAIAATVL